MKKRNKVITYPLAGERDKNGNKLKRSERHKNLKDLKLYKKENK